MFPIIFAYAPFFWYVVLAATNGGSLHVYVGNIMVESDYFGNIMGESDFACKIMGDSDYAAPETLWESRNRLATL